MLPELCPYCSQEKAIIWVHGHGQCAHCGVNTDECCRGENTCHNLSTNNLVAKEEI